LTLGEGEREDSVLGEHPNPTAKKKELATREIDSFALKQELTGDGWVYIGVSGRSQNEEVKKRGKKSQSAIRTRRRKRKTLLVSGLHRGFLGRKDLPGRKVSEFASQNATAAKWTKITNKPGGERFQKSSEELPESIDLDNGHFARKTMK